MPKVTIAIPTFNRREFLSQTLTSIQNQTFRDFDVIIFDNHSNYDVRALIAEFPNLHVTLEQVPENVGPERNFSRAFIYAYKSPYVMIFHDDDTMHPEILEREVAVLEKYPEVKWVGSKINFITDGKRMGDFGPVEKGEERVYSVADGLRQILSGFHLGYNTLLYRKEALLDNMLLHHIYDKWTDRPLIFTMAGNGKVAYLPVPLVNYRVHAGQDSGIHVSKEQYVTNVFALYNFYRSHLPQPLSRSDEKLFYSFVTNNSIPSIVTVSGSWGEFWQLLQKQRKEGLFRFSSLNARGLYFLVKTALRKLHF